MQRLIITVLLILCATAYCQAESKWVITRSGTPNLVPDTLTALTLAILQGGETVELNVALSGDGQLLLGDPDITLAADVGRLFADRKRADGNFYVPDFTYLELRQLSLSREDPGPQRPGGTALPQPVFSIDRFDSALGLIRSLEDELGRRIRIVVIPRKNWLYRELGKDLSSPVIATLKRYGYTTAEDGAFVGSYDPAELRRIKEELQPAAGTELPLLQLVDTMDGHEHVSDENGPSTPYNYDWIFTKYGLKAVSTYANGIGLPAYLLKPQEKKLLGSTYLENGRLLGMSLLYYPVSTETQAVFTQAAAQAFVEKVLFDTGLDGLVTVNTQQVTELLQKREQKKSDVPGQQQSIEQLIETIRSGSSSEMETPLPENPFKEP